SLYNDGNSQRGWGYDIIIVTECAYTKEKTLRESIKYLVSRPGYAGYLWVNSTPRGLGHWWDQATEQARKGEGYWGAFELWEGNFTDNPKSEQKDYDEYLLEKASNREKCRKEMLAWTSQLVSDSNDTMADGESIAFDSRIIDEMLINNRVVPTGPFRIGVDVAGGNTDWLAIVVVDSNGVIVHVEYHRKTGSPDKFVDLILRIYEYWKPINLNFDAQGELGSQVGSNPRLRAIPAIHGITTPRGTKADKV